MTKAKNFVPLIAVAVLLTSGISFGWGSPAVAAAGNCTALKDVRVVTWYPDQVRVIANCSYLGAATEARGYVNMLACCDKETSWFRNVNVNYSSAWATGNYEGVGVDYRDY